MTMEISNRLKYEFIIMLVIDFFAFTLVISSIACYAGYNWMSTSIWPPMHACACFAPCSFSFRTPLSGVTKRNSTERCHNRRTWATFQKMYVQNLWVPFPYHVWPRLCLGRFTTTRDLSWNTSERNELYTNNKKRLLNYEVSMSG